MGITYSFVDSVVYGAEDVNDITKSIVGAGVAPFTAKDSYNVSDLNAMTSALVGSGVQLEGCKCTALNVGTQNMKISVAQGIVFFEGGVRLTVDSGGYTVAVSPNTAGYVYAYFNPSLQTADILFGMELPSDGEYVQLAKVATDGTLTDKRDFARAKVATLGSNLAFNAQLVKVEFKAYKDSNLVNGHKRYAVGVVDADISKFSFAIAECDRRHRCVFNLKTNTFFLGVREYGIASACQVYYGEQRWYQSSGTYQWYGFEVVDGVLTYFTDIREGEENFIYYPDSMTITLV